MSPYRGAPPPELDREAATLCADLARDSRRRKVASLALVAVTLLFAFGAVAAAFHFGRAPIVTPRPAEWWCTEELAWNVPPPAPWRVTVFADDRTAEEPPPYVTKGSCRAWRVRLP